MIDLYAPIRARKENASILPSPRSVTTWGDATGYVYFASIGEPMITHVKIGYSAHDPLGRIRSLQTGSPFRITMIGYIAGCLAMERDLHEYISEYRCQGEWFEFNEYVEDLLKDMLGVRR